MNRGDTERMTNAELEAVMAESADQMERMALKFRRGHWYIPYDDLIQIIRTAFVEANRPGQYRPELGASFPTYAFSIAYGRILDLIRQESASGLHVPKNHKAKRIIPVSMRRHVTGGKRDGAEMEVPGREEQPRPEFPSDFWERVNESLTPRQQQLVQMYYRDGLTRSEIARQIGLSGSSVGLTLKTAITNLNKKMPELQRYLEGREP